MVAMGRLTKVDGWLLSYLWRWLIPALSQQRFPFSTCNGRDDRGPNILTLLLCTAVCPVMGFGTQSGCFGALQMPVNGVLMKRVD